MKTLWIESQKDKMSIQSLKFSDYVCTTTEKLAKTFKTFNKNVKIFRNQFDWNLPQWNYDKLTVRKEMLPQWFSEDQGKIVIGWAGLTSHYEDIKRMHNILKVIHDSNPDTVFVLAGMALKDSQVEIEKTADGQTLFKERAVEDKDQTYRGRVENLYSDFDPNRIAIFDAMPLESYAKFYALFDISLAYVEHNTFNSCKSEIKVVESIHYSCIPVYSLYGGYQDFYDLLPRNLKDNTMAVSTMSPQKWINSIQELLDAFRKNQLIDRIAELKKFTDQTYDINLNSEERLSWYLDKIEKHEEVQVNSVFNYSNCNIKI